ncbi:MAG: porin [Roseitalea porphyridii]|uniref:porin n=1 Tax=Roseitalea porphyridii TaxID=1852022 RepID=UPI0032D90BDC
MKIRSLLLGSAAAMTAVTTANAADIIIPEPEVVEYVRVCDAAGEGYFYIPGSETCLRISGYAQYEMNFDGNDENFVPTVGNDVIANPTPSIDILDNGDAYDKAWEARLLFEAWRQTELGELTTVLRLTAGGDIDWQHDVNRLDRFLGQTDANVTDIDIIGARDLMVDRAYFELAGLRIGLDVSLWDTIGFGGPADAYNVGGPVTGVVRYTADFGPATFALSLEEDTSSADYLPAAVASVGFAPADFSANLAVAVQHVDVVPAGADRTLWGVKGNASYDFGPGAIGAGFQYSGNGWGDLTMYNTSYEWVLGADVTFDATEALELGLGFQYGINEATSPITLGTDDDWIIGALASYDITETLNTNLRLRYDEDDDWSARLRFRSSF